MMMPETVFENFILISQKFLTLYGIAFKLNIVDLPYNTQW